MKNKLYYCVMNSLLTQAVKKLGVLSEIEQEIIAERILLELQYLRTMKAKSSSDTRRKKSPSNDLKIINKKASQLNKEAIDVLYTVTS
ncbi:MAG: hypothetical protein IPO06_23975 [Leptospiraceae bacterium]|nr:hypothetical protein [Leptospiraceae bacterium]